MIRPPHKSLKHLAIIMASTTLLNACGSSPGPNFPSLPTPSFAFLKDTRTEVEKEAHRRLKSWQAVADNTDARRVPGNRVQITTDSNLPGSLYRLEDAFLIRAAAEALEANYDGFVIKYLDYEDSFFKWFNQPIETYPEVVDIWQYEDFLIHSEEQNFFSSRSSRSQKRVQGVVEMVRAEEMVNGQYFKARETFDTLIGERDLKYR